MSNVLISPTSPPLPPFFCHLLLTRQWFRAWHKRFDTLREAEVFLGREELRKFKLQHVRVPRIEIRDLDEDVDDLNFGALQI